jgi:dihydrodipicolinate reductase
MSKSIAVAVHGASGRSGSLVLQAITQQSDLKLVAALVSPQSKKLSTAVRRFNLALN